MHASDGTALYLMSYASPVALSHAAVESEIADLATKLRSSPERVLWLPEMGTPTGVIAWWGGVRLDELGLDGTGALSEGKSAKEGVLVDILGDLIKSAKDGSPIYRVVGSGSGFVYTASFTPGGRGHRRHVAIDAAKVMIGKYEGEMKAILERDKSLPASDFKLWRDVAEKTRRVRLDTSLALADAAHGRVFRGYPSKLRSHLWARLPGSAIQGLGLHEYRPGVDHYSTQTLHPTIRSEIRSFITSNPGDPFIEFAHYVTGDLDKGLQARPNSPVKDVLHYGIGHRNMRHLAREILTVARNRDPLVPKSFRDSDDRIAYINKNTKIFDDKPIAAFVGSFAQRAQAARTHFLTVVETPSSPLADDAAYMLGFLAYHAGDKESALSHFEKAMQVGNGDYKDAAIKQAGRALMAYPPAEQVRKIEASPTFMDQDELIYVVARSAYRAHDFSLAITFGESSLARFNIPAGRLPATTDPERVEPALRSIAPQLENNYHITDIAYIIEASRELRQYVSAMRSFANEHPDVAAMRARAVIIKYSRITEDNSKPSRGRLLPDIQHKDLRQALYLSNVTLEAAPKTAPFAELRQWLYYRKARIQTIWEPKMVADTVAAMRSEAPDSKLADDALTEQIFAEGIMLHDIEAAQRTFQLLLSSYPAGNALDNAHSWMAIALYCAGRKADAQKIDRETVRRFPLTRHANYARTRLVGTGGAVPESGDDVCRIRTVDDDPDTDDIENLPPVPSQR
jgi:tetratricopeptide (TPR) repeat protein